MAEIAYFVPGSSPALDVEPLSPLQVYLPSMQAGVVAAYIEAYTRPGDLVLDMFCQTPQVIREGLALGRRVLATNLNPVVACAVELSLAWNNWPDRQAISAAFTHLLSVPTGSTHQPLEARLATHYTSRCPTCRKPAQAQAFVWDRDRGEAIEKRVQCAHCQAESSGVADDEDMSLAKRYEPRSLPYWLLLERVAGPEMAGGSDERERAAAVLAAYTPRALAAISDILIRLDALPEDERVLLRPLLLETLAECSMLHPNTERGQPARPRSLKAPATFVERSVLSSLEKRFKHWMGRTTENGLSHASQLEALLAGHEPAGCLLARSSREIAQLVEAGQVALAVGLPPEINPTFWALGAVWSAWLWGKDAAEILRPLLSHRRANTEWLWRALTPSMHAVASRLPKPGKLVLIHHDADDELLGALALAGAGAKLTLEHALVEPHDGLRMAWRPGEALSERQLDIEALGLEVMEVAEQATLNIIRARSEPSTWPQLAAGIYQAMARTDLLRITASLPDVSPPPLALLTHFVRGTFEGRETALQRVEGSNQVWWTNRALGGGMEVPLSDLVELAVYDALQQAAEWEETALLRAIYSQFPGDLTPERSLVQLCLESYAQIIPPGVYSLREEDRVAPRRRDIEELRDELATMGKRIGWEVESANNRMVWSERRTPAYTFVFSATAQLAPHLLTKRPPPGTPVLVIPGGRARLIEYKLRRNVQFRDAAAGAGWQFLKFRPSLCEDDADDPATLHLDDDARVEEGLSHHHPVSIIDPSWLGGRGVNQGLENIVAIFNSRHSGDLGGDLVQPTLSL